MVESIIDILRICRTCGKAKPLSEYGPRARSLDGISYHCKECVRATNRAWTDANPEKAKTSRTAWMIANPEKQKASYENWYSEIPGRRQEYNADYYATHAEERRMASATWRLKHPEEVRAQGSRRRARKASVLREEYTDIEIFERDNWICHECCEPIDKTLKFPDRMSAAIDHWWPISLHGPDIKANVFAAHFACNSKKWKHLPDMSDCSDELFSIAQEMLSQYGDTDEVTKALRWHADTCDLVGCICCLQLLGHHQRTN